MLDYQETGPTADDTSAGLGSALAPFALSEPAAYSATERQHLLLLARGALRAVVTTSQLPTINVDQLPPKFLEPKGCFVTLTKAGALRGCIGHIFPREPLYQAVVQNARGAALHDSRFAPVQACELDDILIELSVLTDPEPLAFTSPDELIEKLQPHRDGVVLRVQGNGATFLPQVWEKIPDKAAFLSSLSLKAGRTASAWRDPGTTVMIYHVEAFTESE